MTEVDTVQRQLERFRPLIGDTRADRGLHAARKAERGLASRVVWNVNSTAAGGGVAEMLRALLGYVRGAGIDCRWATIDGDEAFFRVTKRLHHSLHGSKGDCSALDDSAREIYERVCRHNAESMLALVKPFDVVLLHDPQTAGMAAALMQAGILVIWRCHIGHDKTDDEVESGWAFLEPYLRDVPALVFSRAAYIPRYIDTSRCAVISPSIDAFSPKNEDMTDDTVRAILVTAGLIDGRTGRGTPSYTRDDGSTGRVVRKADVVQVAGSPDWDTPLVVQVSRWDPLKDPVGVMRGFQRLLERDPQLSAHLVLAGPDVRVVVDDPEGAEVFQQVLAEWQALPEALRAKVHLVNLPMEDIDENAAIVNALQRHAAVVVQKSLHEGFGLTVTEAMWKARPVVASAVGGIQDQVVDGVSGVLLKDPADVDEFASVLDRVLRDTQYASKLGKEARERVREHFLGFQHLVKYAELIARLDGARLAAAAFTGIMRLPVSSGHS